MFFDLGNYVRLHPLIQGLSVPPVGKRPTKRRKQGGATYDSTLPIDQLQWRVPKAKTLVYLAKRTHILAGGTYPALTV